MMEVRLKSLKKAVMLAVMAVLFVHPFHQWEVEGAGTEIPESALTWNVSGSTAQITGYDATFGKHNLIIPDTVDGLTVTEVTGFQSKGLTGSITIPDSVTRIGDSAFRFNQLTSVNLPSGLEQIESFAFDANQLTSIDFPSSITFIGNSAFSSNNLASVEIPSGVTSIGNYAFMENQLTSVTLPDSLMTIGNHAFYFNVLTNIDLPSNLTSIGSAAFHGNNLTNVVIPDSVKNIGSSAFSDNQLTNITIPDSVTTIGELAFSNNQLTNITIPDSVTTIGSWAFSRNKLMSVTFLRDGTWTMEIDSFNNNPNLQYMYAFPGSTASTMEAYSEFYHDINMTTAPTLSLSTTEPTNEDVIVTIDSPPGMPEYEYRIDDGAWTPYMAPFSMTDNGTIKARYTNAVEKESDEGSISVNNIDREKPVITLIGPSSMTITRGSTFTDPGVTAIDNVDGDISSNITVTGSVYTDQIGVYSLIYDVADRAGNEADSVTRTVTVRSSSSGGGGGGSYTPPTSTESKPDKEPIKESVEDPVETPTPSIEFSDIDGHWAEGYIMNLVGRNAIDGYPDGTFKPDDSITRAEFTAIIIRVLKLERTGSKTFLDTKNHWAQDVIATAYEHGIVKGYNESTFGPDDPITREQMAKIIVNAFALEQGEGKTFSDHEQVSPWAEAAVQTSSSHSIITGYVDGTFRPKNNATRAEAVAVVVRALTILENN